MGSVPNFMSYLSNPKIPKCDDYLYASTLLGHGMPRYLIKHDFLVCLCFWMRLNLNWYRVKQFALSSVVESLKSLEGLNRTKNKQTNLSEKELLLSLFACFQAGTLVGLPSLDLD